MGYRRIHGELAGLGVKVAVLVAGQSSFNGPVGSLRLRRGGHMIHGISPATPPSPDTPVRTRRPAARHARRIPARHSTASPGTWNWTLTAPSRRNASMQRRT
jgi:hypothetical protein